MGSVPPSTGAAAPGLPHPARGQPCHVREHLAGQRQARAPPGHPHFRDRQGLPAVPPVYYEGLQDKLAQIRDARGALSALREEHREKLRRAAEEAERQRQIQLAQKLEIMRQKKQVRRPHPLPRGPAAALPAAPGSAVALTTALWPAGVPGGAEAAGHPAPAGAGEGAADAPGAAEADHPDARPDARLLPALRPGTRPPLSPLPLGAGHGEPPRQPSCSVPSSRPCPRRAACSTSPLGPPAFRGPSARQARRRAPPCTPCT